MQLLLGALLFNKINRLHEGSLLYTTKTLASIPLKSYSLGSILNSIGNPYLTCYLV